MTENISPDQSVGEHVCDIDCWDKFTIRGSAWAGNALVCNVDGCIEKTSYFEHDETLGDMVTYAKLHCERYHQ